MGYSLHGVLHLVETALGRKDRGAGIIATRLSLQKNNFSGDVENCTLDTLVYLLHYFNVNIIKVVICYTVLTILY